MARGTQICAIFQFDLVAKNLDHEVWGPTFYVNCKYCLVIQFIFKFCYKSTNRMSKSLEFFFITGGNQNPNPIHCEGH